MKNIFAASVFALLLAATPVRADSTMLANDLGSILAAEEFCGLEYNQDAISAFIEKKVPAQDMGFAGMLNLMTSGNKIQQQEMSKSSKTAHCTAIKRTAKRYGFVK